VMRRQHRERAAARAAIGDEHRAGRATSANPCASATICTTES
jgi:hypothetical protein